MNDRDLNHFVPQNGMDVIGADGEKIGGIDGVEREYFVVRKGFFFPQDHYIPMTAISSYDDTTVYLNVTKNEALEQEWHNPPVVDADTTIVGDQDMLIDAEGVTHGGDNIPPENTAAGIDPTDASGDDTGTESR